MNRLDIDSAQTLLHAGLLHGRRGEWHACLASLRPLFDQAVDGLELPGVFWSMYGHALARCERRLDQALVLCRRGVEEEFYRAEPWLHLAAVHLLRAERCDAFDAVARGLALQPTHAGLVRLHRRLGRRRAPVLPFLGRSHPLNVRLGRLRQALTARSA